jgi:hypothetical protein
MLRVTAVLGAKPPPAPGPNDRGQTFVAMPDDIALSGCMIVSEKHVRFDFTVPGDQAVAALRAIVRERRPATPRKLELLGWGKGPLGSKLPKTKKERAASKAAP